MWECRPARSRPGAASTRRTASSAAPEDSENPNFWSSWAVATNSWVCASTPLVTRTRTFGRCPPLAAAEREDPGAAPISSVRWARRAISSNESTTMCPTPAPSARSSSSVSLLLPCRVIIAGSLLGDPAQHPPAAERLGGVEHRAALAERLPEVAAAAAEVLLVQHEQRRAVLLRQLADIRAGQGEHTADPLCAARPDRRVEHVQVGRRHRGVLGRQHVGVARACWVGDTAHGTPLLIGFLTLVVGGWPDVRSQPVRRAHAE